MTMFFIPLLLLLVVAHVSAQPIPAVSPGFSYSPSSSSSLSSSNLFSTQPALSNRPMMMMLSNPAAATSGIGFGQPLLGLSVPSSSPSSSSPFGSVSPFGAGNPNSWLGAAGPAAATAAASPSFLNSWAAPISGFVSPSPLSSFSAASPAGFGAGTAADSLFWPGGAANNMNMNMNVGSALLPTLASAAVPAITNAAALATTSLSPFLASSSLSSLNTNTNNVNAMMTTPTYVSPSSITTLPYNYYNPYTYNNNNNNYYPAASPSSLAATTPSFSYLPPTSASTTWPYPYSTTTIVNAATAPVATPFSSAALPIINSIPNVNAADMNSVSSSSSSSIATLPSPAV